MKEYQARTEDLGFPRVVFDCLEHAQSAFRIYASFPKDDYRRSWVLVLAEWETEAEADEKRLDWIEQHGYDGLHWASMPGSAKSTVRETIDAARNAPKPKVTIVDTGIEAQLRQAGSDYDTARGH